MLFGVGGKGFGLLDWRDGWFDDRGAPGKTADVFCEQVRAAVARSKQRGRVAIVIADNLKTHMSASPLLVRSLLIELADGEMHERYSPPGRREMPEQFFRIPQVVHPCSRGYGAALLVPVADTPSRWERAARRQPQRG